MILRAAEEAERNQQVLALMERVMKADTRCSTELQFKKTKISAISSAPASATAIIR
jgi:hypothetical protein